MKNHILELAVALSLFIGANYALAERGEGVGPAEIDSDSGCFFIFVIKPIDTATYGDYVGAVVLDPDGNQVVWTNSNNGNINFSCSTKVERGQMVLGYDPVTFAPIPGTLATREEAYNWVLSMGGSGDAYKGKGNGAVVINGDTPDLGDCTVFKTDGTPVLTPHWQQVVTPGGTAQLSCHYME